MHKVTQQKNILKVLLTLLILGLSVAVFNKNSSAIVGATNTLNIQDDSTLTVSFVDDAGNPTTDTTNISLQPTADGVFNSGNVNVNVDTNSPLGYTLTMSASTSSLSRSEAVGGNIPTIPTIVSATTIDDFPSNFWGYMRTTSGLSGATSQITDSLYQPMKANHNIPISSTGVSASKSISTVNFGVKLDTNTPSGNYSIGINFLAVSNVAPYLAYMQDATPTSLAAAMPNVGDSTVLYDRRDNQEYTVAKLADGKYWMTRNLAFEGGILTPEDSDVIQETVITYYQLDDIQHCSDNYDTACIKTDPTYGAWYNYAAATAMSVIGDDTNDAVQSICPANWKMPSSQDQNGILSEKTAFGVISGGIYYQGVNSATNEGLWWSSTLGDYTYHRDFLIWNNYSNDSLIVKKDGNRQAGYYVRCLFDATMQNYDTSTISEGQTETLVDARDGNTYTVAKINGNTWMTQNLRFTGTTLTPADSNVTTDTTMTYYSLDSSDSSYANHCDSANGYNYACIKDSGSTETGVWYNFTAASAGTLTTNSNTNIATSSICPKGWHIPTGPATDTSSEFYKIFNSTSTGWITPGDYLNSFKIATGGRYRDGVIGDTDYGNWWSATARNATYRYRLSCSGSQAVNDSSLRYVGFFLRCIAD